MHTCACAALQSGAACRGRRCQRASLQRVQAHGAIQAGRHKPLGAHGQAGDHRGCAPALERLSEQALGCARGSGRLMRCGVLYRHYQGHGRVSRQGSQHRPAPCTGPGMLVSHCKPLSKQLLHAVLSLAWYMRLPVSQPLLGSAHAGTQRRCKSCGER